MQSDTDYDYKYAVLCNACTRIYVIEVPAADYNGDAVDCPRCGQTTVEIQEADHSRYRTCVEAACSQYLSSAANIDRQDRCEGKRTDKKGLCNAEVEVLSLPLIEELPPDNVPDEEDEHDPAEVRRLKAMMQKVRRWIHGSGAHHRSTGGSHTAAATQTHSAAHRAKKRVRDAYAAELKRLAGEVDADEYSSLVQDALSLANAVLGK